jgi:hypothetical protein
LGPGFWHLFGACALGFGISRIRHQVVCGK